MSYLPSYYDFGNHNANKRKGLEKRGGVGVVEVLHVCPLMELLGFFGVNYHWKEEVDWKEEVKGKSESCQLSWILGKNGVLNTAVRKPR